MGDIFVICSQGPEELIDFLNYLNNINPNIQFTMETESKRSPTLPGC